MSPRDQRAAHGQRTKPTNSTPLTQALYSPTFFPNSLPTEQALQSSWTPHFSPLSEHESCFISSDSWPQGCLSLPCSCPICQVPVGNGATGNDTSTNPQALQLRSVWPSTAVMLPRTSVTFLFYRTFDKENHLSSMKSSPSSTPPPPIFYLPHLRRLPPPCFFSFSPSIWTFSSKSLWRQALSLIQPPAHPPWAPSLRIGAGVAAGNLCSPTGPCTLKSPMLV